ncbi:MAG TPA: hypothetical protein G4N90_01970 [Dehalococcoidia bacterium]|nr:hypothetical protein [Dehalococcoidia bacterium]
MQRTWKGTTAGILTLIGGICGIAVGGILATVGTAFLMGIPGLELMAGIGVGIIAIGVIALIAGIFTLRRRSWGFALAGAILALFPIIPLGILAIIFVAMGKSEFE